MALAGNRSQEFQKYSKRIDLNPSLYFAQVIPCINSCKIIPIVKAISTIKPTKGIQVPIVFIINQQIFLILFVNTVLPDKIIE
jgi:hypothetical protein